MSLDQSASRTDDAPRTASGKMPAFQFYTGDWLKDSALMACSLAARGLWIDMLCFMHESPVYGHLQYRTETPFSTEDIARLTGCAPEECASLLGELERRGVLDRTASGVIYSRRMVRDHEKRLMSRESGSRGGNPALKGRVKGQDKRKPTPSASSTPTPTPTPTGEVRQSGGPNGPLLGAIADVTGSDRSIKSQENLLAKTCQSLAEADPPYTPEEVRLFGQRYPQLCPWARTTKPTIGELEKYIGRLRSNTAPIDSGPQTKGGKIDRYTFDVLFNSMGENDDGHF
ncbi:MAG: hypothetical protein LC104_06695 [Bacteroidales bacterium]|nr:hypothetical protein [Bacteroidales bacterium]